MNFPVFLMNIDLHSSWPVISWLILAMTSANIYFPGKNKETTHDLFSHSAEQLNKAWKILFIFAPLYSNLFKPLGYRTSHA